jgi:hypothetical protein
MNFWCHATERNEITTEKIIVAMETNYGNYIHLQKSLLTFLQWDTSTLRQQRVTSRPLDSTRPDRQHIVARGLISRTKKLFRIEATKYLTCLQILLFDFLLLFSYRFIIPCYFRPPIFDHSTYTAILSFPTCGDLLNYFTNINFVTYFSVSIFCVR